MPITDVVKKQIAQQRRLFKKVCMRCGMTNSIVATHCRKCGSPDLRFKNRQLGLKK